MIRLLCAFSILLASVTLGIQLNKDPGYVLLAIHHWTIETTLWVLILSVLVSFLILHFLMQLGNKIARTPGDLSEWNRKRLAQKAQAITCKGLIEYSEGYWQKAKNHLIQALPNTDTPLINYLTAARAAQKMGDSRLRDSYLREAQQSMPEAKIAVELTQAQLQLANHQWEQALATLHHLHDIAPNHPYVLKLIMQLYQEVRDWQKLIALLPKLKKYRVISLEKFQLLEHQAYLQRLIELIKHNQPELIYRFFHTLPKSLAKDPNILVEYVPFLLKHNDEATAKNLLCRCLRKEIHPQLILLYSLLTSNDEQLAFAESLLKKNSHSATLYLCLSQLCSQQQLWGKAKHYLQQSIDIEPTALAYLTQGKLYEKLGDKQQACGSYKQGLQLVIKDIQTSSA